MSATHWSKNKRLSALYSVKIARSTPCWSDKLHFLSEFTQNIRGDVTAVDLCLVGCPVCWHCGPGGGVSCLTAPMSPLWSRDPELGLMSVLLSHVLSLPLSVVSSFGPGCECVCVLTSHPRRIPTSWIDIRLTVTSSVKQLRPWTSACLIQDSFLFDLYNVFNTGECHKAALQDL